MNVAYGTSAAGSSQQHTGAQVPIAAHGPGAANVVGLSDQTDTFFTMRNALGLETDFAALSAAAAIDAPAQVKPQDEFEINGSGFAGDRQVELVVDGETERVLDVVDAAVAGSVLAPAETGDLTVVLRGVQTGVEVSASVAVSTDEVDETPDDQEEPNDQQGGDE